MRLDSIHEISICRILQQKVMKYSVIDIARAEQGECSMYPVGFKMFLGVTASVTNWDAEGTCCSIVLEDNPLVDFVELPENYQGLYYCDILSGVVRGALDMVSMKAEVTWLRDALRGDDVFELQVKLLKQVPEEYSYKDDE
ncbi:hypothetical protein RYX36_035820 [Vicia faba]